MIAESRYGTVDRKRVQLRRKHSAAHPKNQHLTPEIWAYSPPPPPQPPPGGQTSIMVLAQPGTLHPTPAVAQNTVDTPMHWGTTAVEGHELPASAVQWTFTVVLQVPYAPTRVLPVSLATAPGHEAATARRVTRQETPIFDTHATFI